jgi:predicted amidophosphoribosyltransferase
MKIWEDTTDTELCDSCGKDIDRWANPNLKYCPYCRHELGEPLDLREFSQDQVH